MRWWAGTGLNRRHQDFQFSTAIDRIAHFSASCDIKGTRSPSRHVAVNRVVLRDVGDNLGDRCLSRIRARDCGPPRAVLMLRQARSVVPIRVTMTARTQTPAGPGVDV